jgi:hypothetical protein
VRDVAVGEDITPSGDLVELNWSGEDVWPSSATVVPPFGDLWYTVHLHAVVWSHGSGLVRTQA